MSRTLLGTITTELKRSVKGSVFASITNGTLYVDIYDTDFRVWRFTCDLTDLTHITSTTCKIIADSILEEYRARILEKAFFLENI